MSQPIFVTLLWHQHQPTYADPGTGGLILPWVRLHAVKDYVDMALVAERYTIKQTINLVPILMEQLEGYASGTLSDRALDLSRRPAGDLDEAERQYLLDRFFDAHETNLIQPSPRYWELWQQRREDRRACLRRWTTQDWCDLQVWFNLAWMDPLWKEGDGEIAKTLVAKGRDFSEHEKNALLDRHLQLCGEVVKVHRRLQDDGLLEVITSPYAHPILPLLCDTDIARECQPADPLPKPPFRHPEDADRHLAAAVEIYQRHFGRAPTGMWPSEGSVSPQAIKAMRAHGIQWCATDEAIVGGSDVEIAGIAKHGGDPYRPYWVDTDRGPMKMIFRDHELSDLIGFHYGKSPAHDAASHFTHVLTERVRSRIPNGPAIAPVILDGENCWEYYPRDGHDFIKALVQKIQRDAQLEPLTVSEALERFPEERTGRIRRLKPGSWINGNFRIWIGGSEENLAWDILRRVRDVVTAQANTISDQARQTAWHHIMLAEGSDWFWWYGDINNSAHDAYYDAIFRGHLKHALQVVGAKPFPELDTPITEQIHKKTLEIATGRLAAPPDPNALGTDFFGWQNAIALLSGTGGAMHEVAKRQWSGALGWYRGRCYLQLRLDEETRKHLTNGRYHLTWRLQSSEEVPITVKRFAAVNLTSAPIPKSARTDGYLEVEVYLYDGDTTIDRLPYQSKAVLNLASEPTWLV